MDVRIEYKRLEVSWKKFILSYSSTWKSIVVLLYIVFMAMPKNIGDFHPIITIFLITVCALLTIYGIDHLFKVARRSCFEALEYGKAPFLSTFGIVVKQLQNMKKIFTHNKRNIFELVFRKTPAGKC